MTEKQQEEPKAFRVRQEDGYVWIDPKTRRAQDGRKLVMAGEDGIKGQEHKLQPLNARELAALQSKPAGAKTVVETGALNSPSDRMVRARDVRRRNRKKED